MITPHQHRLWTRALLGEIALLKTGPFGSALHKSDYVAGGTPIVNPMHIVNGRIIPSDGARVSPMVVARLAEFRLVAGDVVLGRRGEMGRCAVVGPLEEGWLCGTGSLIIRSLGAVQPRYLQRYLSSPDVVRHLEGESVGSTMVNLNQSILRDLEVPVPPILEQNRIADKLNAILGRVDACRKGLDRVPSILKRFRKSVLAAATSGELTRDWREERGRTKDWLKSRIEDIAAVGTGSTPLRANTSFYSNTGTPWITSAATGLPFVTQAEEFVTDAAIAAHRLKKYPAGTLLVAMYGEGKTRGQVTELRIEATINQACAAIAVDESKATRAFVKLALESSYLEMRELAEGGNQPNLNLTKIKEFPLSLPPLDEQRAIAERVEAIGSWVRSVEARVRAAQRIIGRLAPAVLAKAFRGELVPQDPDDEPASELLARLRRGASSSGMTKPKRGGTRNTRTKAKVEDNMLTRKDVADNHLSKILKERGALTAEALWSASQLEIDDFYDQLKDEEARGLLHESRGNLPTEPRLLEPAA